MSGKYSAQGARTMRGAAKFNVHNLAKVLHSSFDTVQVDYVLYENFEKQNFEH